MEAPVAPPPAQECQAAADISRSEDEGGHDNDDYDVCHVTLQLVQAAVCDATCQ